MTRLYFSLVVLLWLGTIACSSEKRQTKVTVVSITLNNGYNQVLKLEKVALTGEADRVIDSFAAKERVEQIRFLIQDTVEGLYVLRSADSRISLRFINDRPAIGITVDYMEPDDYSFDGSPASARLRSFLKETLDTVTRQRQAIGFDRLPQAEQIQQLIREQQWYRNFMDTVRSPALALYFYNHLDYGTDHAGLDSMVTRLRQRFAGHPGWEKLYTRTQDYLSIFREELKPGDVLPDIVLPSTSGSLTSVSSFKGKYLLVDFWATWQGSSMAQLEYKKKAWAQYKDKGLNMVSISFDPERQPWKQAVRQYGLLWPQLIDEQVWMGPSATTFKMDSIPFNFLADPSGKIVATALYGDSLLLKLGQLIR